MRRGRMSTAMRAEAIERRRVRAQARIEARRQMDLRKHPGKPVGNVRGSWLSDLAERRQCVLLCWQCKPKWNPEPYGYFYDRHYEAQGQCDTCNAFSPRIHVFMHECYVDKGSYTPHTPAR